MQLGQKKLKRPSTRLSGSRQAMFNETEQERVLVIFKLESLLDKAKAFHATVGSPIERDEIIYINNLLTQVDNCFKRLNK